MLSNSVNQYYLYVTIMVPECARTDEDGTRIDVVGTWTDICHRHGTQTEADGTWIDMVGTRTDI